MISLRTTIRPALPFALACCLCFGAVGVFDALASEPQEIGPQKAPVSEPCGTAHPDRDATAGAHFMLV